MDKQVIKLQETPDSVPAGQTPHSVTMCAYDELVDLCKAGDRVEITGIFKASPVRVNPRTTYSQEYLQDLHRCVAHPESRQEAHGYRCFNCGAGYLRPNCR